MNPRALSREAVDKLTERGARVSTRDARARSRVTLTDPEGNESCVS
ncbi:VOC family protein [Micromonospora sp. NPDC092111]